MGWHRDEVKNNIKNKILILGGGTGCSRSEVKKIII